MPKFNPQAQHINPIIERLNLSRILERNVFLIFLLNSINCKAGQVYILGNVSKILRKHQIRNSFQFRYLNNGRIKTNHFPKVITYYTPDVLIKDFIGLIQFPRPTLFNYHKANGIKRT